MYLWAALISRMSKNAEARNFFPDSGRWHYPDEKIAQMKAALSFDNGGPSPAQNTMQ